ncbi:MAG: imelysin family protein [Pseudomonadota bacterium]
MAACAPKDTPRSLFFSHVYDRLDAGYARLAAAAGAQRDAVDQWCGDTTDANHAAARAAFPELALAWSAVEWLRLGPIVADHRFERLFYWPDRGGRGRRQLIRLLQDPPSAGPMTTAVLAEKSVAVQGLPALEYLLFGDAKPASVCRLAPAVAAQLAATSAALAADWSAAADLTAALGTDGASLSSDRALAAVLQAADQHLKGMADYKIAAPLGDGEATARPGLAPFAVWGQTAATLREATTELTALFSGPFQELLPAASRYQGEALLRELATAGTQLEQLADSGSWSTLLEDARHRARLNYLQQPLLGGHALLSETLSPALNLTQGFNSADGD